MRGSGMANMISYPGETESPMSPVPVLASSDQYWPELGIREFQFDTKYLSPVPGNHQLIRFHIWYLRIDETIYLFPLGFNFKMFWWISTKMLYSRNYQGNGIISLTFSIWWKRTQDREKIPSKSKVGNSTWNIKIEVDNKSFEKRNTNQS